MIPMSAIPFIVGVPRSGTTLLRLMLDAHSDLSIPSETHFIPGIVDICRASDNPGSTFVHYLISHPRWHDWHLDEASLSRAVGNIRPFDISRAIDAFYQVYAGRFNKPVWGDKTPGYMLHLRLIHHLFPNARFIHILRDVRDIYLSMKSMWWGPRTPEATARWWKERIFEARRQAAALPEGCYMEVRFDDLILAPEDTLKQVCQFIDLPFQKEMLVYHASAKERIAELGPSVVGGECKATAGRHQKIFSYTSLPPQPSRLARWKVELDSAQKQIMEKEAGDLLAEIGYETGC
jgi:hypothetical protein